MHQISLHHILLQSEHNQIDQDIYKSLLNANDIVQQALDCSVRWNKSLLILCKTN